ncbi:uncharacterized protein VTP21DRAFT_7861 [Calcarisporiella thermophila]|uniref:uncharacterized protein n=1 Tax=Calcarisporiella thermophila TaxID=911321 RepID=UPI0037448AB7
MLHDDPAKTKRNRLASRYQSRMRQIELGASEMPATYSRRHQVDLFSGPEIPTSQDMRNTFIDNDLLESIERYAMDYFHRIDCSHPDMYGSMDGSAVLASAFLLKEYAKFLVADIFSKDTQATFSNCELSNLEVCVE